MRARLLLLALTACERRGVPIDDAYLFQDTAWDTSVDTDLDAPIAVCSADPTAVSVPNAPPIRFRGAGSYDPAGSRIVDWSWSFHVPAGSAAHAQGTPPDPDRIVQPDIAGTYAARLIVTTEDGRVSGPCIVRVEAVTRNGLNVMLYWDHAGDDLDLHLVQAGAALTSNGDCYYGDCVGGGPDWGVPGFGADNPAQDLDDIPGVGPENIGIVEPAAGQYDAVVHDFHGIVYHGRNHATIVVTTNGTTHTFTRTISTEDRYYYIARITFPGGDVVECPSHGC